MSLEDAGDRTVVTAATSTRTVVAFAAVAVAGVATALLPASFSTSPAEVLAGVLLTALILGYAVVRSLTGAGRAIWLDRVPPFLFFPALALARDATGGSESLLAPLVLLPLLWLALSNQRREMLLAGLCTTAMFAVPIVVVGGERYPADEWRRVLGWTLVAFLIVPAVQRVVERLARETERVRRAGAERDGILRAARLTSMVTTDLDGTVRSFSPGAEDMLGYAAADVVGRHPVSVLHDPQEIARAGADLGLPPGAEAFVVLAALARQNAPSRIWTYVRVDGTRLFVRAAFTELRDDDDALAGYLAVAIDATTAVTAERALALSDARWRAMTQRLPGTSLLMVDHDMRIELVAGSGLMRTGLIGAEGKRLPEVSNPRNTGIISAMLGEAFEGRESVTEVRATADGAPHELVVTPLPPDGETKRALVIARDITEERDREAALVAAKQRAERLFADAPHGVVLLDPDGTVMQVNAAMETITGWRSDDLAGTSLGALTAPGHPDLVRHLRAVLTPAGSASDADWTLRDRHGTDVQVALSSRVLRGAEPATDGEPARDLVLVHVVDVSERKRYEERLAHLADHDPLTGLANRRRFDQDLQRHLDHSRRYGPRGALLVLDLDRFKEVNDTLGHGAGDQLIISTARLLRDHVRSTDVVARLGGDEFAVLLTEGGRAEAEIVATSIVEQVRSHTASLEGTRRRVTASIGAVAVTSASEHAADVLALADLTMYDAKEAGRDRVEVLSDTGEGTVATPRSGARLAWKSRIEQALEHERFELHYQPILDLRTGRVRAAEALLRMRDGDELVAPGRFLYIAERSGLVPEVDSWVVRRSVEALAGLQALHPDFRLEVNLSGHSIGHPQIEQTITDALDEQPVDPSALILEITETAAVSDVEIAREFAERLTALGCKFALDDFGAGFGSFYYLKHLLFDYVKIDGEFVATCHRSPVDRTILRSIVGIARDLGKQTVAEFVSEPAILDVVRAEGVDHAQGFLVGEPMPYQDLVDRFLLPREPVGR